MKRLLFPTLLAAVLLSSCNTADGSIDYNQTLALIIIIVIIALFFVLAAYSNLLRDTVNNCDVFEANARKIQHKRGLKRIRNENPYSLSRVQLAVWTVIISCSYIYLELCMGNCNSTDINQTALVLMGIGAGVTAAGSIMDNREIQNGTPRHQNAPSEGFFVDLLSDDQGISIHRFQNVVWTFIAMVIYLHKVCNIATGCDLPELSDTLLALTGISGATYLVLKSQENGGAEDASEPANNTGLSTGPAAAISPAVPVPPTVNPLNSSPVIPDTASVTASTSSPIPEGADPGVAVSTPEVTPTGSVTPGS
ncbi:hypothetical protein [Pedobacter sp. SYSU D00535]|uniref:hypothetical protein n=1 Tax=Pedobacter sp. SYSU D00535 TaxID=2810308 RepID=UPI001A957C2F|nr:hypothetical protein [Pedobacter sp. SYSU D00535]